MFSLQTWARTPAEEALCVLCMLLELIEEVNKSVLYDKELGACKNSGYLEHFI